MRSWKAFSASCCCERIFPAKSCWNAWRSGSQLARGQVNMVDEAKLHSPIHSTFEVLVVWWAVSHCCGEVLGPFCWPVLAAGIAIFGASHRNSLSILLRCIGFIGIQKTVVDQTGSRPPNSNHDLFLLQVGFGTKVHIVKAMFFQ